MGDLENDLDLDLDLDNDLDLLLDLDLDLDLDLLRRFFFLEVSGFLAGEADLLLTRLRSLPFFLFPRSYS